ncbi:hypothetical protein ATANTOWER_030270 [Ataeniobius toweri]|uniref:Uncharacterized protein n=1 Tax=Ataeniobius toweri TaxID=208326 RepID=A0ABU7C604_9TELE|nr:hypothetical protein [Ataeniobius toweri]
MFVFSSFPCLCSLGLAIEINPDLRDLGSSLRSLLVFSPWLSRICVSQFSPISVAFLSLPAFLLPQLNGDEHYKPTLRQMDVDVLRCITVTNFKVVRLLFNITLFNMMKLHFMKGKKIVEGSLTKQKYIAMH